MSLSSDLTAKRFVDRATAAWRAGLYEQGRSLIGDALHQSPDDPHARYVAAQLAYAAGEPQQALEHLDIIRHTGNAVTLTDDGQLLRVRCLVRIGAVEQAMSLAQTLLRQAPAWPQMHRLAAAVAEQLNDAQHGHQHLAEAVRHDGSYLPTRRLLAQALARTRPDEALAHQRRVTRLDPTPANRLALVRMLANSRRFADAEHELSELLDAHPDDGPLWIEAGELAEKCSAIDLAVRRYQHASSIAGQHAVTAELRLAACSWRQGQFAYAVHRWWRLMRADQGGDEPILGLLAASLWLKRSRLLDHMSKRAARSICAKRQRIAIARLWREAVTAKAMNIAAAGQSADNPRSDRGDQSRLQDLLNHTGHALAAAALKHPQRADVHYHLAVLQRASDRVDQARSSASRALSLNPRYRDARQLKYRLTKMVEQVDVSNTTPAGDIDPESNTSPTFPSLDRPQTHTA